MNSVVDSSGSGARRVRTGKIRYAICGLSVRGIYHFLLPLLGRADTKDAGDFRDQAEVVGILDLDLERIKQFQKKLGLSIPSFTPIQGVEAMIRETHPDVLLVAGPDFTHAEYILAGLRNDLRVIAEKPAVINSEQIRQVLAAEKKSQGSLVVAHNYRYTDINCRIKELLLENKIGRPTNIEYAYNLDTFHGASYFYRWNRERSKSGGLSIHKSVHHLDLISWLIDSPPETVFAFGARNYYGPHGAHRPKSPDGRKLTLTEVRQACPYFQTHYAPRGDKPSERIRPGWDKLELPYAEQYPLDNYIYDEAIDIEDTYSSVIRYRNGASMAYSINFSAPWEGYTLAINGTRGRLEVSHRLYADPTGATSGEPSEDQIVVWPLFGAREEYDVPVALGGHGGADPVIRRDLFLGPNDKSLRLKLSADSYAGALAIATGEAIWRSAQDGRSYQIRDLLGECYRPAP